MTSKSHSSFRRLFANLRPRSRSNSSSRDRRRSPEARPNHETPPRSETRPSRETLPNSETRPNSEARPSSETRPNRDGPTIASSGITAVRSPHSRRPATRNDFEIAVICALPLEADAVSALFDHDWDEDNGPPYGKALGDINAYSTGAIGCHNVVLIHLPNMGKAGAAIGAANCMMSFPNIKLAIVVGICGAVPFKDGKEIVLGDVIISEGVVQYDFGRETTEGFAVKTGTLDSLGRPGLRIRGLLQQLKTTKSAAKLQRKMADYMAVLQAIPELQVECIYPGVANDKLFGPSDHHPADEKSCERCKGEIKRSRLKDPDGIPQPAIHIGLIASGDKVMKDAEKRDAAASKFGVVGFEMEGAGAWDLSSCIVIKGVCDYADSHKAKGWQRYAAATAAACMKAFLESWEPLQLSSVSGNFSDPPVTHAGPWFLVPYPRNEVFVGRKAILERLKQLPLRSTSQTRVSLFGLGGIGKTQIVLEYAYWLQGTWVDASVFWVHASNAERFRQSFTSIAQECRIPGYDDSKSDVLPLVKKWLESKDRGFWVMIIDNADDAQLFFGQQNRAQSGQASRNEGNMSRWLPECAHGSIVITTRDKQAALKLAKGKSPIEVSKMDDNESDQLLRTKLEVTGLEYDELSALSSRLENLPLALAQAAAFIQENCITVDQYIKLLDGSDQQVIDLLSEEFETVGRDSETSRAVAKTWILSFEQIQRQNTFASELLAIMSFFDRQAIPTEFLTCYGEGKEENRGEMALVKALGVLKAFSFVTMGKDETLDVHRLVQLVTRKWLDREQMIDKFAGLALLAVSNAYPFVEFENWPTCRKYLPHAYSVLQYKGSGPADENLARASLLHSVGTYLYSSGLWKDAERLLLEAVEMKGRLLGEEHIHTLTSMGNLALTFRNQGRWEEAEELGVQVIKALTEKLGADHLDTLTSMGNLALTFWNQGRWEEAEELEVQVVEARTAKLGVDHPDTLTSMDNLASTFRSQDRWEEAEELGAQVVKSRTAKLGADHPDTLTSMSNLASTFQSQGRWEEAEELEVQVMKARTAKLGADHPNTLTSMGNLASTFWNQGRWEEAEELEVQVMKALIAKLGANHPNTLTSMNNLACTWKRQGRLDEAMDLMRQCVLRRQQVLGPDHSYTTQSRSVLREWEAEANNI
ncbi:hypothetical protein TWF696_007710 [Orbilia brochopaga]|uniref:Nucleoside phosphorylase domain-containing protein n=1 Tax=Orbilia brochopaga TaxID=3140254 RepID=A0AAV9UM47_9PEZI